MPECLLSNHNDQKIQRKQTHSATQRDLLQLRGYRIVPSTCGNTALPLYANEMVASDNGNFDQSTSLCVVPTTAADLCAISANDTPTAINTTPIVATAPSILSKAISFMVLVNTIQAQTNTEQPMT